MADLPVPPRGTRVSGGGTANVGADTGAAVPGADASTVPEPPTIDPSASEGIPGTDVDRVPAGFPAPSPTFNPPTTAGSPADADVLTAPRVEVPERGSSENLKTDRVFREGDPDFTAASDTTATARGNLYPQTYASAIAEANSLSREARNARRQADDLQGLADQAARRAAELRGPDDPDLSLDAEADTQATVGTGGTVGTSGEVNQ